MSGILKNFLWLFFVLQPRVLLACPACLTSSGDGDKRVWLVGMMGLLPVVLAGIVGYKIYQLCHSTSEKVG